MTRAHEQIQHKVWLKMQGTLGHKGGPAGSWPGYSSSLAGEHRQGDFACVWTGLGSLTVI